MSVCPNCGHAVNRDPIKGSWRCADCDVLLSNKKGGRERCVTCAKKRRGKLAYQRRLKKVLAKRHQGERGQ